MTSVPDRPPPSTVSYVIATAILAISIGYFVGQGSSLGLFSSSRSKSKSTSGKSWPNSYDVTIHPDSSDEELMTHLRGPSGRGVKDSEDEDEDEDEEEEQQQQPRRSRQSQSRRHSSRQQNATSNANIVPPPGQIHTQPQNSRPQPDTSQFIHPVEPARPAVYGPPGPRPAALRNPLPPPPRDLYEMTPYKQLLNLPQTTALLTATYGNTAQQQQISVQPQANVAPAPATERKKSIRRSLLRAFSTRRNENEHVPPAPAPAPIVEPNVRFIPVFVPAPQGHSAQTQAAVNAQPNVQAQPTTQPQARAVDPQSQRFTAPQTPGQTQDQWDRSANTSESSMYYPHHAAPDQGTGPADAGPNAAADGNSFPPPPVFHESTVGSDSPQNPTTGAPHSVVPVRFDQQSRYAGFMNHSPHRVIYRNKTYPSATNLHEAMKYLDRHPDLAETIRLCKNIADVYPLSARYQQYQREDWGQVFLKCVCFFVPFYFLLS